MTDRPIPFSAPMVRALLDGRKSQTRRVIRSSTKTSGRRLWPGFEDGKRAGEMCHPPRVAVGPDGKTLSPTSMRVGDRLYVREAWRTIAGFDALPPRHMAEDPSKVTFEADPENRNPLWAFGRLRQGMHMPRWASRLTLVVTDVRVQRVQEISDADIRAEGAITEEWDEWREDARNVGMPAGSTIETERDVFRNLWDGLNGKRPGCAWEANPWVIATSFTVYPCNIDAMPAEVS